MYCDHPKTLLCVKLHRQLEVLPREHANPDVSAACVSIGLFVWYSGNVAVAPIKPTRVTVLPDTQVLLCLCSYTKICGIACPSTSIYHRPQIYAYMCVHTDTQTAKQTTQTADKQTDRQTHRQTHVSRRVT